MIPLEKFELIAMAVVYIFAQPAVILFAIWRERKERSSDIGEQGESDHLG